MSGLAGTGTLLRLAARRDRLLIPLSVVALAGTVASSAKATFDLYPNADAAIPAMASLVTNPALVAMYGPLSDPQSIDAFATFKVVLLGAVFVGILVHAVVRRHTRLEEEEGRMELLGSGAVGRRAPLAAAVLLGVLAVASTAVLTAVGATKAGLDAAGSVALGAAWATLGLTWVGVTAVAAQLTESARGTAQFALGALGVAFLLRLVGDTAADDSALRGLTWLSPLGWVEKVAPYGANRLWVLGLGVVSCMVLVGVAFTLLERRDVGGAVLPPRAGPAHGGITSHVGLVARLGRGTVLGWAVLVGCLGLLLGSIAGNVDAFVQSNETADMLRKMGGSAGSMVDTFFATEFRFMTIAVAAMGVSLVLRMRADETNGRAEAVLATATTRVRWAVDHLVFAAAATTGVALVMAVTAGLSDGRRTGNPMASLGTLVPAALVPLPAAWCLVAVAMLLVGWAPRWAAAAWAVLVLTLLVGELGPVMGLPNWVQQLSPLAHVPHVPGGAVSAAPLVALTLVALGLGWLGVAGLRRRDIPA